MIVTDYVRGEIVFVAATGSDGRKCAAAIFLTNVFPEPDAAGDEFEGVMAQLWLLDSVPAYQSPYAVTPLPDLGIYGGRLCNAFKHPDDVYGERVPIFHPLGYGIRG